MSKSIFNKNIIVRIYSILIKYPLIFSIIVFAIWSSIIFITGQLTSPLKGDEDDYLALGILTSMNGVIALNDGYRPPLLILIISAISKVLSDNNLIIFVRLFNLFFISIIPGIWLLVSKSFYKKNNPYIIMAFISSIYYPFYFFGSSIHAEAISILGLNVLIIETLDFYKSDKLNLTYYIKKSIICGFIISALFLTKANNILVAPVCIFIILLSHNLSLVNRLYSILFIILSVFILSLPWILFLHNSLGEYKLTTTGGYNFLVGTGYYSFGMADNLDKSVLPIKYIISQNKFHNTPDGPSALSIEDDKKLYNTSNTLETDNISLKISKNIWSTKTHEQIIHGFLKILHSIGFSLRGWSDYIVLSFTFIVISCSLYCAYNKLYFEVINFHWMLAISGFLIAFVFLPNIRFKTFYFDSSGLLVISFAISLFVNKISNKYLYNQEN